MVRVNRVRRIIRKIDPWTVLKVTLVLNFVVALTVVLGFSIMWVLLVNAGVPQGLEDIARRLALLDQDASLVGNIEPLFTGLVSLAAVYMLTQTAIATVGAFLGFAGASRCVSSSTTTSIPPTKSDTRL